MGLQNFNNFQAFLQLSKTKDKLIITNRKPIIKPIHVLEADRDLVEDHKRKYRNDHREEQEHVDSDHCPSELDESRDQIKFEETISSASCLVSDIQAIIFGGQSSRFWMLRKHINSMSPKQLKNLPFYSWNCITLQLKNRDVDLVIKHGKHMRTFLEYLVYKMRTLDGIKDSGNHAITQMALELQLEANQERMKSMR